MARQKRDQQTSNFATDFVASLRQQSIVASICGQISVFHPFQYFYGAFDLESYKT
ncbi:hypothetical protein ACU8KH_00003 [Lachancea thermotolerans]